MRRTIWKLLPLVCAVAALAGCTEPGLRARDKSRSYNQAGKTMVVVIDISGSMNQNDPDRASVEGMMVIAGLAEEGDNIGVVAFSSDARIVAPIRTIRTPDDRRALCAEVTQIRREGSTNFVAGLARAREMLEDVNAPAGSTVLFMTDGQPNVGGGDDDIRAQAKALRDRNWKCSCIGYAGVLDEARSTVLPEIAARTAGGYYQAKTPRDLLQDYVKITGELQDILVAPEIRPVRLFPGTSRLLYVVLKGQASTRLTQVTREGQPIPLEGPQTFHYPGPEERSKLFDVFRTQDPPAGKWNGNVEGPYEVGMILMKAPFEFSLAPGAPKREQVDGRPVTVTLYVKGNEVDQIKNDCAVMASVADVDGNPVADLKLAPTGAPEPKMLAFTGEFTPHLKEKNRPETHTVTLRFTYRDGDVVWTHDRTVSYQLVPPPTAAIEVDPTTVDLGTMFAGEPARVVPVTVRASGAAAKHVVATAQGRVTVNPSDMTDLAGPVKVLLQPAADASGDYKASVTFKPVEGGDDASSATVTLRGKFVNLRAPGAVTLGDVQAGETASAPIEIAGDDPRIDLPSLNGPNGGTLPMKLEGGKLKVEIPRDAPPGKYEGTINVSVGGATKKIPVSLTVTPPQAKLSGLPPKVECAFSGAANGWTEPASYSAQLEYPEPCAVNMTWTDLKPAGGKGPSLRASDQVKMSLEGLENGKLAPGKPAKLKASAYVNVNLPPGTYTGTTTLTVKSPDGRQTVREVPVELKVTR